MRGPGSGRLAWADVSPGQRAANPLVYQVFDLLYLDGRSLLNVPLEARKRLLRGVLREHAMVRYTRHVEEDGEAFFRAASERGVEGMMAKLRWSRYEPGRRSQAWLKVKVRLEQELVVGGYVPGAGRAADLGALLVGVYADGSLRYAGRVGSGLNASARRQLLDRLEALRRPDAPFSDSPRVAHSRWVEPQLVIRAQFAEWTTDGLLRQAAFKGLELDHDPHTVIHERPEQGARVARALKVHAAERRGEDGPASSLVAARYSEALASTAPPPAATGQAFAAATPDELEALERLPPKGGRWHVDGRDLPLTNLGRVLFPDAGLTKRDLIRYYVTTGPVLLPYLAGRALTLCRWPDGVDGPHFWQRELPHWAPGWVARGSIAGSLEKEAHTYIVADNVATLAWLANMAAIELHPWTSLTDTPDRPTYALIDIDPGEGTTWEETVLLARLYRDALRHLRVTGYPKVTGKRGIHVWIPVGPLYTFEQTRAWVEAVSRAVGATVPDLVSWAWGKAERRGLARLDYTQNAMHKTLVGPYVVRASPNASVSAPISWDELDDPHLRADRWTIATIVERLRDRGDLFRGVLDQAQQLPPL